MARQPKVVVAYLDGRRLKGFTHDFSPSHEHFYLTPEGVQLGRKDRAVLVSVRVEGGVLREALRWRFHAGDRRQLAARQKT